MTIDEGVKNLEYSTNQLEMEIESGLWIKESESELCCREGIALNKQLIEWLTELKELKAANAEPVKHGYWETWGYVFHDIKWKRCSLCHKTADVSYSALIEGEIKMATSAICGCCGARMDVIYQDDKIRAIKVT